METFCNGKSRNASKLAHRMSCLDEPFCKKLPKVTESDDAYVKLLSFREDLSSFMLEIEGHWRIQRCQLQAAFTLPRTPPASEGQQWLCLAMPL